MRKLLIVASVLFASGVLAQWVPWQVVTPRQRLDVTGKGETVTFPLVDLPAGMVYRVHTEERVDVGDGGISDARYYVKIIPIAPPTIPVCLKMQYDVASEDWFNSGVAPAIQSGYQSNHIYDALVTSRGVPLAFRFYDRQDPPAAYYDDNSGRIVVEVSRETPGLAVKYDTLDFGTVAVGQSNVMIDSIQGYGKGYQLDNTYLTGNIAPFSVVSERTVPFGIKDATNEFQFTFSPTVIGRQEAHFHLISSSAFGSDQDRIIVLIGNGARAQVTALTDTLDFGTITVNTTKTLDAIFANTGNLDATIQSVQVTPVGQPFSATGVPLAVVVAGQATMPVTFAPLASGQYFAAVDAQLDDGSRVRVFAKGAAGIGKPVFDRDTLFFDTVIIGMSQVLTTTMRNLGDLNSDLTATNSTNSNPEFSIIGNPGPFTKTYGSGEVYTVTFSPSTHIPNYGVHTGVFTLFFTDQGPKSVYFFGYDHLALEGLLVIDSHYYVNPGKEVIVKQYLKSDLTGTLNPARQLSQTITYDQTYFDLVGIEKGAIISSPEWSLASTTTPGQVNISIGTATSRFTTGGELLKLRFRAKPDAPVDAYTYLPQTGIDFGGLIEPLAASRRGKITIADICTPVRMTAGALGTYIEQNNPNPFNPTTNIKFSVGDDAAGAQQVSLRVYDAAGRLVKVLVDEPKTSGVYQLTFDASELPSGVYMYSFRSGDYTVMKKMIVAK